MKLYLSSFKIGDHGLKLAQMIGGSKKLAVISNALDCYSDIERRQRGEVEEIEQLSNLGIQTEIIDLRDYFDKQSNLEDRLNQFDGVWVRGGSVFVLRVAMALSGFDQLLHHKLKVSKTFVYAGYSAGGCVLSPTLEGYQLVDQPELVFAAYPQSSVDLTGLGIINFIFEPHYRSDHPESALTEKEIFQLIDQKHLFKAFRDGEVYLKD